MASDQLGPYHAYGKINWSLLITGVREDGYHLLDTVMQRIDLCDEITLIPADSWSVSCSDRRAPRDASNTALVAARAYAAAAGLRDAYHIAIEKRIPVGAGLGGGSADAAAVLSALNEKYAALTEQELLALALSVGADVPFCLAGGCARCTGVGEVMAPARGGEYHLVVAGCGANLSTAAVFRHYDGLVAAEGTDVRFDPALLGWAEPAPECDEPFHFDDEEGEDEPPAKIIPEHPVRYAHAQKRLRQLSVRTGGQLTADLVHALSTGNAEAVAKALNAFSRRVRGNDPFRAAMVGDTPCDERYAAEADCMLCIAGSHELLCGANDLTFAACDLAPGVAETLLRLRRAGALATSMSGSGSACFGLFSNRESAEHAAESLSDLPFCAACSTLKAD